MKNLVVVLVIAFAFSTIVMASDIAFYVGQFNTDGWYDESQFTDVETIIAETGHLFNNIQQFNDDDLTFAAFNAWVEANTDDGEMDIIWLNGCTPSGLYPNPNELPDGSRIEAWLDGGNMVINVGDWFAYATYEGGPRGGEGRGGDNGGNGAANILDLSSGIIVGADGTMLTVTPAGQEYLPSLGGATVKTDRPVVLSAVQAPWEVAAIFASSGGTDDPAAEVHADPLVIHNTETGGYIAFINQASGGPDGWIDDRGLTCAEFIGNWVSEVVGLSPVEPVNPGTDGLAAAYVFDADAADSSGNGLDGTLLGDAHIADGVLVLDGDDDAVAIPGIGDGLTEFTFSMMVYPTVDVTPLQFSGGINTDNWTGGVHLKLNYGNLNVGVNGLAGGDVVGTSIVEPNNWTHLALTVSPTEVAVYVNGVKEGSRTGETVPAVNVGATAIGAWNNSGTDIQREMTGMMDDVLIYNRALSEAEIRYLAGERATPVDPGSDGLLARWSCDEGEGAVVGDASGNGRDGMFVNGDPAWVEGVLGSAVELVGPTLIETPPLDLELTEATMAGWILPYGVQPDWSAIIMQRDPGLATGFNVLSDYQLAYHWNDTSDSWGFRGGDLIAEDDWTFVAVTIEPDKATFYVNGEQGSVNEVTHEPCLWNSNVYLGGDGTDGFVGRRMIGALDEVVMYDRALSAGEIRYLAGFRMKDEIDPSLVIYYSFDEVSDIVADQSGKGHDGTVVGDVTAEAEGMIGGAANFANGGYLDLDGANFPAEDIPTSAMTLAAWIKCANTGGDHEIFNARASDQTWIMHPEPKSSGDIRWLLRSYGGTTIFQIRNGTMTWDEWLHFAGTYDKETGKAALYINGELIEEVDVENPADIAGDWGMGARVGLTIDDARPFTGLMDELRMYTRALSQDEILEIMQGM